MIMLTWLSLQNDYIYTGTPPPPKKNKTKQNCIECLLCMRV